ncbi:MAG: hydroxymethylbilane synthase [Candidatus Azotimanducaceae bacterium]
MGIIRLATRESTLAMWQANYVKTELEAAHSGLEVEIVGMTTLGDRNKHSPLSKIGGKGVFVKELEVALIENRVDIAVHSMKDVPSELPDGLQITAICEREDPRDAFVSVNFQSIDDLPDGARIGSSSLRRRIQLQQKFPQYQYIELRGNVDTRLKKLESGEYEAIILACAGLKRLGLADRITQEIDTLVSIPSAGQGAVGIESRTSDDRVNDLLAAINHDETWRCVSSERVISSGLGATCNLPIAAFAELISGEVHVSSFVSDVAGEKILKVNKRGPVTESYQLAKAITTELVALGADKIIQAGRD